MIRFSLKSTVNEHFNIFLYQPIAQNFASTLPVFQKEEPPFTNGFLVLNES